MAFQANGTPSAQGSAHEASNSSHLGNGIATGARYCRCVSLNRSWWIVLAMVLYCCCTGALLAQNEVETQPEEEAVAGGIR